MRDANRTAGLASAGLNPLRTWSVTTWLIVICVAVFVLDHYILPPVAMPSGLFNDARLEQVDPDVLTRGKGFSQPAPASNGQVFNYWLPVIERSTGRVVGFEAAYRMRFLESYLHFSTRLAFMPQYLQWWRFIGFQFLHANGMHLLFNMIGLYFFGPLVEDYLGRKRYLAFYLLCGIFGALMYLALNLSGYIVSDVLHLDVRIPGLLFTDPSTPLVGASAGIFGIIMAGAFMAPNAMVYVFFMIPMRLRTVAYVLVGVALYTLITGGRNAGGEAGHLGGALAGAYFIRHPHLLHGFFDFLGRADPTSHHYRDRHRPRTGRRPSAHEAEIDRILTKIHQHGLHSLTDSERYTLSRFSGRR